MARRKRATAKKTITKYRTRTVMAPAPRRRRSPITKSRRRSRHSLARRSDDKGLLISALAALGFGFLETSDTDLSSLKIGPLDPSGTLGLGLWAANKFGVIKSPMVKDAARGLIDVQAYKFGKEGFSASTEGDWDNERS